MLRLGEISFINAFPLSHEAGLILGEPQIEAVTITCAPPSQLNQHILDDELDISPVSSAFYCRHQDKLVLLAGPCIASTSPVKSVLFICPSNWQRDNIRPKRIWIPDTSETSILLLQWMLSHDHGPDIEYFIYDVGKAEGLVFQGEAVLTIGDEALRLDAKLNQHKHETQVQTIDLARYWKAQTGLPCVFAVWVARKDWYKSNKALALQASQQLSKQATAFQTNLTHQRLILDRIETLTPQLHQHIGRDGVKEYLLTALSYNLDEDAQAALSILKQICQEHDDNTPQANDTSTPQRIGLVPA